MTDENHITPSEEPSGGDLAEAKLLLEIRELEQKTSRSHIWSETTKTLASLAGVATAGVAVAGLIFSVNSGLQEISRSIIEAQEKRIIDAMTLLSSPESKSRIAGVSSLRSFIRSDLEPSIRREPIISSMLYAIALEDNGIALAALAEAISEIPTAFLDEANLIDVTELAIDLNRSIVRNEQLQREVEAWSFDPEEGSPRDRASTLLSTAGHLVTIGAQVKDFSSTYCRDCNFTKMNLSGTSFRDAVLDGSNFSFSNLEYADFNGARIDRVDFFASDLEGSDLGNRERSHKEEHTSSTKQVWDAFPYEVNATIEGPSFECANLVKADFTGRALFGYSRMRNGASAYGPLLLVDFQASNIEDANLQRMQVFLGFGEEYDNPFGDIFGGDGGARVSMRFEVSQLGPGTTISLENEHSNDVMAVLAKSLLDTNWRLAKWPQGVEEWLTANTPASISSNDIWFHERKQELRDCPE